MGKGTNVEGSLDDKQYSWNEIRKHTTPDDKWIVIQDQIYDVSRWQKKHPGGARIIGHFAGQDATEVWTAMHSDKVAVTRYLKPLLVGAVLPSSEAESQQTSIKEDMRSLRKTVEDLGWFKVSPWFFVLHFAHIVLLEVLAYCVLLYMGTGWGPFVLAICILATAQAQAGWTQHDYGHLSVFKSSRANHFMHQIVIGHLKGASSHWWNFRHFQHHAKPNVYKKDPDITLPHVFLMGDKIPVQWGLQHRGKMPYQHQHNYFWILGPISLLPVYFHLEVIYFVFKRRDWLDLFWISTFFARFFYCYSPLLGPGTTFGLYMLARTLESVWFTFVTQMNHIPMEVDRDQDNDWLTAQTISTCNVESSVFNDWFTGHLNFQIEHHLFPTMPRHNYHKVAPLAESLCRQHNLQYVVKPLSTAFADILRSLKKSGQLWYEAYHQ